MGLPISHAHNLKFLVNKNTSSPKLRNPTMLPPNSPIQFGKLEAFRQLRSNVFTKNEILLSTSFVTSTQGLGFSMLVFTCQARMFSGWVRNYRNVLKPTWELSWKRLEKSPENYWRKIQKTNSEISLKTLEKNPETHWREILKTIEKLSWKPLQKNPNVRSEAFTEAKVDEIFSGYQPCQLVKILPTFQE